jgi:hypothetical protein
MLQPVLAHNPATYTTPYTQKLEKSILGHSRGKQGFIAVTTIKKGREDLVIYNFCGKYKGHR